MGTGSESREETLGGLTRRVTMFRGQKEGAQTRVARVARSMHQCCYTYKREYRTLPRVEARPACLILAEREAGVPGVVVARPSRQGVNLTIVDRVHLRVRGVP